MNILYRTLIIVSLITSISFSQNYSLNFNGSSYVSIPHSSSLDLGSQFTIECWFTVQGTHTNDWIGIISKTEASHATASGYKLGLQEPITVTYPNEINFHLYNYPVMSAVSSSFNPVLDSWYHLAATYDGSIMRLFLNGNIVQEIAIAATILNNTLPLTIGGQNGDFWNRNLNGKIDEVRISSNVRYTSDFNPSTNFDNDSYTQALYHFNEGSGSSVADESGNGNTGTIYGATWSTDVPVSNNYSLSFPIPGFNISIPFDNSLNSYSGTQQFCVSMWIKPTGQAAWGYQHFVLKATGSCNDDFAISYNNLNDYSLDFNNARLCNPDQWWTFGANVLALNEWNHLELNFDGNIGKAWAFINGQKVGEQDGFLPASASSANVRFMNNIEGLIDEIHFSNTIRHNFNLSSFIPSLEEIPDTNSIGLWKLNEGSGDQVYDVSLNNNHGTFTGATWSTDVPGSTLPGPSNLVAGVGFDGLVPLTWDKITATVTDTVDYYIVYRASSSGGSYTKIGQTEVESFVDTLVSNGTPYFYVVTAKYTDGEESGNSAEVSSTPTANGMHINLPFTSTVPTNDGTINSSEWSDAYSMDIKHPGVPQPITLYIKNDANNLYIAMDDPNNTSAADFNDFLLFFDDDNNDTWNLAAPSTEGYYILGVSSDAVYRRVIKPIHGDYPNYTIESQILNPTGFTSNYSMSGGHMQYEISIDLSTSILTASMGDEIGIRIASWNQDLGSSAYYITDSGTWPYGSVDRNPLSYGKVTLGSGQCEHGWVAATNQQYNMSVIGLLKFEDVTTLDESDAIGAFVGNECRGIASPIADLDGKIFLTITSDQQSGETVTYKAWNDSDCEELAVLESFEFVNQSEVGTLGEPFVFNAGMVEMQYDFGAGYTWFSVNIDPGDMGINNVFNGLSAVSNDRIIGQTQFAVYDGSSGQWVGSLLTMDPKQMYIMKLASSDMFTLQGLPIDPTTNSISLNPGYTWIGYIPQQSNPINTALANMSTSPASNDRMIGQTSFAVYDGGSGTWVGSLLNLNPGDGYKIRLTNSTVLTYPTNSIPKTNTPQPFAKTEGAPDWTPVPNLQYNMQIIGRIMWDGAPSTNTNDMIGAFVDGECRGVATTSSFQNLFFLSVGSNVQSGEEIYFKEYNADLDQIDDTIYPDIEPVIFNDQGELGSITDPWTVQSVLPVEFVSFTVSSNKGSSALLQWETATEINNYGFEVERKINDESSDWKNITFIEGAGNSNSTKLYRFEDKALLGGTKFIYRLKQLDNDGTYTYSDAVEVEVIPTEYTLFQNYPNPFNPSTKIRFSIIEKQQVDLRLYNAIGEEVLVLAKQDFDPGYHEVQFRANSLAGGIYFYRIVAGNFVDTKKMILLK